MVTKCGAQVVFDLLPLLVELRNIEVLCSFYVVELVSTTISPYIRLVLHITVCSQQGLLNIDCIEHAIWNNLDLNITF